ncbi:hypothetical protein M569_11627 [Genlisea aurea]|uniref:Zinc finger CCCH domain-containing protein 19 n=1 Tax=Genlisea aurea TaxID=192259 RepID=S8DTL1_9LAMI|nr:hypothetical protein M569_11627 [Genlisea aurea]
MENENVNRKGKNCEKLETKRGLRESARRGRYLFDTNGPLMEDEELKIAESTVECEAMMDSGEPDGEKTDAQERREASSEGEPADAGGAVSENQLTAATGFDCAFENSLAEEKIELPTEVTDEAVVAEPSEKPNFHESPTVVPKELGAVEGSIESTDPQILEPKLESEGQEAEKEIDPDEVDMGSMQLVQDLHSSPRNFSDDASSLKNDNDPVMGVNISCNENADPDVESSQKPTYIHEAEVPLEIPVNTSSVVAMEDIACVVTDGEKGLDHDFEDAEQNLMVAKDETLEYKEVLKAPDLDNYVNVEEANIAAVVNEEVPSGDIEIGTELGAISEIKADTTMKNIQLTDAEVEGGLTSELVSNGIVDDDSKMETGETGSDVDEPVHGIHETSDAMQDKEDEAMDDEIGMQDTEMETETEVVESGKSSGGKRKRGKVSKSTSVSRPFMKSHSRKTVGEDVCFICFDGGELVLCDRRGCPKAYHPSCVNRDEAFFQSKGRWNCGWHLCSICEKDARYMCYTCTFSLCKSCTKESVIFCVRGSKGFCETCMRTVSLIENNKQDSDNDEVDFDDKNSWEYLFKDYFLSLKSRLSLSSSEIAEAKNPRTGAMTGSSRQDSSEGQADVHDGGSGSEESPVKMEPVKSKSKTAFKNSKSLAKQENVHGSAVTAGSADWASRELLDFVSHMKNGDKSVLSQFDVQALLLDYIKRNKLRDPRRKSQIVCDARLKSLFGKPRVGHFEMLKLLESHFLFRDEQNDDVQSSVVDTENDRLETDGKTDAIIPKSSKDKKRKPRRKGGKDQSNLDDYAAINLHNIGLIYLRRKLMEDLLEEGEAFNEKVLGTFVRIRISVNNQKQDMYRLVQVVGTSKSSDPYKVGKKTTNVMVEIQNLDKTEKVTIDSISNQDFTPEECKRLRQSIKCGLISPLTVGAILDKAMDLQSIRVNDWLETEVMRLSHLRDRASDMGHFTLRECVQKLQLLKAPEERKRRLEQIPDVHSDPKMDPGYESEEDDSDTENSLRGDAFTRSSGSGSGSSWRERGFSSPRGDIPAKEPSWDRSAAAASLNTGRNGDVAYRNSPRNVEPVRKNPSDEMAYRSSANVVVGEKELLLHHSDMLGKLRSPPPATAAAAATSSEPSGSVSSFAVSPVAEDDRNVKVNESEKMWHYVDPSGKVQGPFSVVQLRKWNRTGYFPADLRIWRATESQDSAFLLTDALAGKFPRESDHRSSEKLNQIDDAKPRQSNVGELVLPNNPPVSVSVSVSANASGFSPTPIAKPVVLDNSAVPLRVETEARAVQTPVAAQPLQVENQVWVPPGVQPPQLQQGYNWGAPGVQNPGGVQPAMPENSNVSGWGPPMQPPGPTPNMGWVNPAAPSMNWGVVQQVGGNATPTGWVPPPGGSAGMQQQGMVWAPPPPTQGWVAPPAQGPMPGGNGWGPPPSGNMNMGGGGHPPPPVQAPGPPNQGWVPPPPSGGQGSWPVDQNHGGGGGQFSGQRGGRPWDRSSSFGAAGSGGGGGSRFKRDTVCPYNANGRCIKGSRCDYKHV